MARNEFRRELNEFKSELIVSRKIKFETLHQIFLLVNVFAVLFLSNVYAGETFPDLGKENHYQGTFVQERHLSVLLQPLISKGKFSIVAGEGVVWSINEPFSVQYSYNGNTLLRCADIETNKNCIDVGKKEDPMLHGFFSFFYKVLGGDKKSLLEWFSPVESDEKNLLILEPKKAFLKKTFKRITLQHDNSRITQVVIEESDLDNKGKADKQVLTFAYQ